MPSYGSLQNHSSSRASGGRTRGSAGLHLGRALSNSHILSSSLGRQECGFSDSGVMFGQRNSLVATRSRGDCGGRIAVDSRNWSILQRAKIFQLLLVLGHERSAVLLQANQ